MRITNFILFQIILIHNLIKESLSYNSSIPFNWTKFPDICYEEDFILTNQYRPYYEDIYPIHGCNSDERNRLYAKKGMDFGLTNITYEPKLDFFFPSTKFPPLFLYPKTSMTFRLTHRCSDYHLYFTDSNYQTLRIYFGRSDDYLPIPNISRHTGNKITFSGKKATLSARFKIIPDTLLKDENEYDPSYHDYEILDNEGEEFNVYFDGFELDLSNLRHTNFYNTISSNSNYCKQSSDVLAMIIKVYDLPRMKVQGLFQYNYSSLSSDLKVQKSFIYTVDTRNIFFQNISMFYNQRVNITKQFIDPTGEDSGFWMNTTCNVPNVATIMVDYFFFDTIHRMQSLGYEFNDRFQLRIHTPFYRKTLNKRYSLFRSQWNKTYAEPRVFIHPIFRYYNNCYTKTTCSYSFSRWNTNSKYIGYIQDIENEIVENEIRIKFSELEKIYKADGFNRSKLVINVNNTMAPHISGVTNGLWAELYDTLTKDWVMKTKTTMDEVNGYSDDDEPDPYRNFYLTCEIPDNITKEDVEFKVKRYGILSTAHVWFRLDVFNKGITKMFPPRFNFVIRLPPQIRLTNETFMYTYRYYRHPGSIEDNWYYMTKDLRLDGYKSGVINKNTFDVGRNTINISELHPNFPNGDDTMFYTQTYDYFCNSGYLPNNECFKLEIKRQYLYYFFDLRIDLSKNDTYPVDMTVYYIKYVPYHSKNQINRGLHRWNPHHAGWKIPEAALYTDPKTNKKSYRYYYEPELDNYFYREDGATEYTNKLGPTGIDKYDGPDCVFNFAGGSTMRNKSCEFWVGLIPDQPFTNYARDIYEEHLAYRTLNEDDTYMLYTHDIIRMDSCKFSIMHPYPGKWTSIRFEIMFFGALNDSVFDGEPKCGDFYEYPDVCQGLTDTYKPISNTNTNPREFFTKIQLPPGMSVNQVLVERTFPCWWNVTGWSQFYDDYYQDYMCFYWNDTYIYAFNSINQWGFPQGSPNLDLSLHIDGVYIYENYTKIEKGTGNLYFGFFSSIFYYTEFPRLEGEDYYLLYKNNYTIELEHSNKTNEELSNIIINIVAHGCYDIDTVFRIDLPNELTYIELTSFTINGKSLSNEEINLLKANNFFSKNNEKHNYYWKGLNISDYTEERNSYVYYPYYELRQKETTDITKSLIDEDEELNFIFNFTIRNYRVIKELSATVYRTNDTFNTLFQKVPFTFINDISKKIYDITITTNTFYTSDRAIYTIAFKTNINNIIEGDYLVYKTSWRFNYTNMKDPSEEGYFLHKWAFVRNYTSE